MRNTNKKGFTIVELVIVVAVIAILAAVLIPTFSGIIAKARLSADKKAVHEMNTFIAMEEADTFEEAIAALKEHGINAEHITPLSADKIFAWNGETKQIEIADATEDKKALVDSIKEEIGADVKTAEALELAIYFGSNEIKLEADVNVPSSINVPAGVEVTIDLNGKKLETALSDTVNGKHFYAFDIKGNLTLKNGTINARGVQVMDGGKLVINDGVTINAIDSNGGAALWIYKGAEVEVNGGTFTAMNGIKWGNESIGYSLNPGAINNSGKLTINGGTFKSAETICYLVQNSGEMVINGGTFEGTHGVVANNNAGTTTINGGSFTLKPYADGSFDGHVVYVPSGNVVISENSTATFGGHDSVFCEAGGTITDKR